MFILKLKLEAVEDNPKAEATFLAIEGGPWRATLGYWKLP
jgi:hypothetical protein